MAYMPIIDGIRLGSLLELHGLKDSQAVHNGDLAQMCSYTSEGQFLVYTASGVELKIPSSCARAPSSLGKPGEGGGRGSFDIFLGPCTTDMVLGREIAMCLFEKGYCVVRVAQDEKNMVSTLAQLRELGNDGKLARLPEEVEEGYLGGSCRGKVAWLDRDLPADFDDLALQQQDECLNHLAQVLRRHSPDMLGSIIQERTPGLVCLTLTDEEEVEYPPPDADDSVLGDFLGAWRRTQVRAVYFLGPQVPEVTLESKGESRLPKGEDEISLSCLPNTILLFRQDSYDYTCSAAEESLMLISNFLSPAPHVVFKGLEGAPVGLNIAYDGPPPPNPGKDGGCINIMTTVTRLPGSWDDPEQYDAGLFGGCDAVVQVPISRWDINVYWTPDTENYANWQSTTRHQSFCEGVEMFDNKFFEISQNEAAGMDPVQRLILETGAQMMAKHGITKKESNRKSSHAGVCVGNDKLDWATLPKDDDVQVSGTGQVLAIIANRFSFAFNLKGPCFVCDTACSASLVSSHLAKLSMYERTYDPLDFFLSFGAHLVLSPFPFIGCSQAHMSSTKGRCFTFNSSADGYLRGEGVSGFVMKYGPVHNNEDRDAIFRGSQVGQDGRSASLTAPNGPAQEEMISRAIKECQMTPAESTCWECHGTGTSLGDPIEVGAVRKVQIKMAREEPLMLASNKSNMGHLEGGAAMAAMIKCVLLVKDGGVKPTLHFRTLNPHLEHSTFDAFFASEASKFHGECAHSQVSSFGFGGTNAHAVFWGQKIGPPLSDLEHFQKRLKASAAPEVRIIGDNPDDWEWDQPDTRGLKSGDVWCVSLSPDDNKDDPIVWKKMEMLEDNDEDEFYVITGNFDGWSEDRMESSDGIGVRMEPSDVPGVHVITIAVPSSGSLEFRFLKNGDPEQVLAPASSNCTRKTELIQGPESGLTNSWLVRAEPGSELHVELLALGKEKSVIWLKG